MSRVYAIVLLALLVGLSSAGNAGASLGVTTRISVTTSGEQADGNSFHPAISADGRFVAFTSQATNFIEGDNDEAPDLIVRDLQADTTEVVNLDSLGAVFGGPEARLSISHDGRFIAFESDSPSLVPGDNNNSRDVFVHDRRAGTTERVSVDSHGQEATGQSWLPAVSGDGRIVAFASLALGSALAGGGGFGDVFVHDRERGVTEPVSDITSDGIDGGRSALSYDGRFVAYEAEEKLTRAILLRDRLVGSTEMVSVNESGAAAERLSQRPDISADGRYVVFQSLAGNLAAVGIPDLLNIYLRDRQARVTEMVGVNSQGEPASGGFGASAFPVTSADGRYVAFASWATNLVPGDNNGALDTFVRDRETGITESVSINGSDEEGNCGSSEPTISADGRFVAFSSCASNLVSGDTNGMSDIFVHERGTQPDSPSNSDPTPTPDTASSLGLPPGGGRPPLNRAEDLFPIVAGGFAVAVCGLTLFAFARRCA